MGLMIHSLEGIPEAHQRDYFVYLLDYGWYEPLGQALKDNFQRMATLASEKKTAVVVMRTDDGIHFSDEVLSWHSINGDNVKKEELLPAILITNRHPLAFRRRAEGIKDNESNLKLALFPLKKYCKNTTEVVDLIQKLFAKIMKGEDLNNFRIVKEKKKGVRGALADSVIIQPNFGGLGIDLKKLFFDKGKGRKGEIEG